MIVRSFEGAIAGMTREIAEKYVTARHVPLMARGTKTAQFCRDADILPRRGITLVVAELPKKTS